MKEIKNINIGNRFGKLTIISPIGRPKDSKIKSQYWLCICDCGEETISYTSQLNSGHKKSCGHCKRNEKIGKTFGKLTVESLADGENGKVYFNCVCECGNKTIVGSDNLISGNTTSCGHCNDIRLEENKIYQNILVLKEYKKENQYVYNCKCLICNKEFEETHPYKIKNGNKHSCGCLKSPIPIIKIGEKFNRLTIIGYNGVDKNNFRLWECKCDCGNIIHNISTNSLTSGNTKSCGCLQKETAIESGKLRRGLNTYDLSGEYGIGYTSKNELFYFDLEDYDKIKKYVWHYDSNNYVVTDIWSNNSSSQMQLHRFIFLNKIDLNNKIIEVDHNNHVPYDDRKGNLRKCEHNENIMNHKKRTDNTSGVTGVYWDKKREKWLVAININKKMKYIGRFLDFNEAVQARKDAEEKYYKEFQYNPKEDKYNKEK